jgi:hypothetical protein
VRDKLMVPPFAANAKPGSSAAITMHKTKRIDASPFSVFTLTHKGMSRMTIFHFPRLFVLSLWPQQAGANFLILGLSFPAGARSAPLEERSHSRVQQANTA